MPRRCPSCFLHAFQRARRAPRWAASCGGWGDGPRRITELATDESVSQPGITLLVNRLVERGWVQRAADPSDGRAVLVSLSPEGDKAVRALRAEYRTMLHEEMASLDDAQVETLAGAVQILDQLIERLESRGV